MVVIGGVCFLFLPGKNESLRFSLYTTWTTLEQTFLTFFSLNIFFYVEPPSHVPIVDHQSSHGVVVAQKLCHVRFLFVDFYNQEPSSSPFSWSLLLAPRPVLHHTTPTITTHNTHSLILIEAGWSKSHHQHLLLLLLPLDVSCFYNGSGAGALFVGVNRFPEDPGGPPPYRRLCCEFDVAATPPTPPPPWLFK